MNPFGKSAMTFTLSAHEVQREHERGGCAELGNLVGDRSQMLGYEVAKVRIEEGKGYVSNVGSPRRSNA